MKHPIIFHIEGESHTDWAQRLLRAQAAEAVAVSAPKPTTPPREPGETLTAWSQRILRGQSIASTFTPNASSRHVCLAIGSKYSVDPATGVMTNLSLLTAGKEALGHGLFIDQKSLRTALAAVQADGGRLRAYLTHEHDGPCNMDSTTMDQAGSELNMAGFFSGISIKGNQLIAGRFEFFDAFKKNFRPQYEHLIEMAIKTPDLLGLSIESWGSSVFVGADGTEYASRPDKIQLGNAGLPTLRVSGLFAAAFVSVPAANAGLFSKANAAGGLR